MRYPIFVEPGTDAAAFGVVVPDLPGCFSAGDTLDEALDNAREAVALWLETTLGRGGSIPKPKRVDDYLKQYRKWIPSVVEIELAEALGENETRSGYIAKLALDDAES